MAITCMHAKSLQSRPTLCHPMDHSLAGLSVHGISRQEYWSGLPRPLLGDLPDPGIKPVSLTSHALACEFFTTSTIWDQIRSVAQSCLTPCDPMNRSMPGLLSITNSQSSLRLTSIESVMPSSHLILCRPLLLLPPIPPSIRVFSNESTLHIRWPKYWSFQL